MRTCRPSWRPTDWDLVVVDEAHKMAASYFGGEVKYTKRYQLGQLLSRITRNFLLMTATPHNGKEADFQLFMALLDGDRFEGKFRDGVHQADASDLMRRLVKEKILQFDGTPLFPERIAYTVTYALSPAEASLYTQVTDYVREEFNRAEALEQRRARGHGRLRADHPAAPAGLLARGHLPVAAAPPRAAGEAAARGAAAASGGASRWPRRTGCRLLTAEDLEDLEDAPDAELEATEEQVVDQATAARTIAELGVEIEMLRGAGGAGPAGAAQRHRPQVGGALRAAAGPRPRCSTPPVPAASWSSSPSTATPSPTWPTASAPCWAGPRRW